MKKLESYIPKDKYDLDAVERAEKIGFPALNPILSSLLEWTIDSNWPIAPSMGRLLNKAGPELIPLIKKIFHSDDGTAKYHMIIVLLSEPSDFLRKSVKPEIERLAYHPTKKDIEEEVNEVAMNYLNEWP